MTGRGLEIRVGLVVLLAGVILVVGTMWFQRFQLTEKRYHFFVRFVDVGGLLKGDPIFVNGVEGGKVDGVDLRNDQVVVDMAVRDGVAIPNNSRVSLQAVGIMGERQVVILRGNSSTLVAAGDTLEGTMLMGLGEVMGQTGDIIDEVRVTLQNLREISETLNSDGTLRNGLEDFAATGKSVRHMTESNQKRIDQSIENMENASSKLNQLLTDHYAALDSSLAAVGRAGTNMESSAEHLAAISDDLKQISSNLRAGKGSAGRLLNDDTLVIRLESATASLDSLLKDMREHPNRYVKFSLF